MIALLLAILIAATPTAPALHRLDASLVQSVWYSEDCADLPTVVRGVTVTSACSESGGVLVVQGKCRVVEWRGRVVESTCLWLPEVGR